MSDTLYKTAKATVPNITEAKEKTRLFISENAILSTICIMILFVMHVCCESSKGPFTYPHGWQYTALTYSFPDFDQSVFPCPVLTVASWPAHRFLIGSRDMNLRKLWEIVKDREAWRAAVHEAAKSQTRFVIE